MNRPTILWISILLVVGAAALTVGCRDDREVPFPPSLIGDYTGIYSYLELDQAGDTVVDTSQLITFRFTADDYQMEIDESIPESLRVFCDNLGPYELDNLVMLDCMGDDCNYTRGVCTQDWNPTGVFGLDQTSDTLRLNQEVTNPDGTRERRLLRLLPVN